MKPKEAIILFCVITFSLFMLGCSLADMGASGETNTNPLDSLSNSMPSDIIPSGDAIPSGVDEGFRNLGDIVKPIEGFTSQIAGVGGLYQLIQSILSQASIVEDDIPYCHITEDGKFVEGKNQGSCTLKVVADSPTNAEACNSKFTGKIRPGCRCAYKKAGSCGGNFVECSCDCTTPDDPIFKTGRRMACSSDPDCGSFTGLFGSALPIGAVTYCNEFKFCTIGDCNADTDCKDASKYCDLDYHECTIKTDQCTSCMSDSECGSSFCGLNGCCTKSECLSNANCPDPYDCILNKCVPKCKMCRDETGAQESVCSRTPLDQAACGALLGLTDQIAIDTTQILDCAC